MLHAADDLAAIGDDDGGRVALERGAEGVVGGQEEPRVAARLGHRLARAVGEQIGVVGPVHGIGRAGRIRQVGGRGARVHVNEVLVLGDAGHGQRDTRRQHVEDAVDLVLIGPLARNIHADIGLVLMIGRDDVDLPALRGEAGILDRHLRGGGGAHAADVGVKAGHVGQDADLDVLVLCEGRAAKRHRGRQRQYRSCKSHRCSPCLFPAPDVIRRRGMRAAFPCSPRVPNWRTCR